MHSRIPHLSADELDALQLQTPDVITALEDAIRGKDAGHVWSAPKIVLQPPDGRYMMTTMAAMQDPPVLVTKTLVLNERNLQAGLAPINGIVTVLNAETGLPEATVDGNWITALRTAGLSALAAKYMANPDATTLGFIGTGLQARSHLSVFADIFPVKTIRVFGRGQPNIDALCDMASSLGLGAEVCRSARDAVEDTDLIVTSVTHIAVSEPFLEPSWLAPGAFLASVDLGAPWHKAGFDVFDVLAVDDLEQETTMRVKLADPALVSGDLAGLVLGSFSGRAGSEQRTAFVFRGHALGDLALAGLAFRAFRAGAPRP